MRYSTSLAIIAISAFSLLTIQCNEDDDRDIVVQMEQSFILDYRQTARVHGEDLAVTFNGTSVDLRHPEHPEYLFPGYAEATILVKRGSTPAQLLTLGIIGAASDGDCSRRRVFWNGYYFELHSLFPDPNLGRIDDLATPPMPDARAGLMVSRSAPSDSLTGTVMFTDYVSGLSHDQYDLVAARVLRDTIILDVEFGGGCKNHYFFMYMAPRTFMESDPVQANLYLRHYDNDDHCRNADCGGERCRMSARLRFDLTPIRELYVQHYGPFGLVKLNVFKHFDAEPGESITLNYGSLIKRD